VVAGIGTRTRLMNAEVYGAAVSVGEICCEGADELRSLTGRQLGGQQHQPLAGDTGIAAEASVFRGIPER